MDANKNFSFYHYNLRFLPSPHIKNQKNQTYQPQFPPSHPAFPILAIAVLTILCTAFLLITYILRRIALLLSRQDEEDHFIALSPSMWNRGLEDSIIQEIPSFKYKRSEGRDGSINGCVVCLRDFLEQDMLRVLPNCNHEFHLDCIDIWLQSNANCPLCRVTVSGTIDHIVAPSSSPQDSQSLTGITLITGDDGFVVIELGGHDRGQEESENFSVVLPMMQIAEAEKSRKWQHVSIMGDEFIDVREKDDRFLIQPIRRSFSLDSATDRHWIEECSSKVGRSLFQFGHGRGSRNAVLPVEFDP